MPVPTDEEVDEFIRDHGPYRVACDNCDRDDFDGVKVLPDWGEDGDPGEVQSLRAALSTYDEPGDPDPPRGYCVLDWFTHLGTCPDCQDPPEPLLVAAHSGACPC
jgi:hypothetical protein